MIFIQALQRYLKFNEQMAPGRALIAIIFPLSIFSIIGLSPLELRYDLKYAIEIERLGQLDAEISKVYYASWSIKYSVSLHLVLLTAVVLSFPLFMDFGLKLSCSGIIVCIILSFLITNYILSEHHSLEHVFFKY